MLYVETKFYTISSFNVVFLTLYIEETRIYFFIFLTFTDLVNVFEVFLPQLLLYPNPSDPLNGEAAALMMRDRTAYEQRVKGDNHVQLCN